MKGTFKATVTAAAPATRRFAATRSSRHSRIASAPTISAG